MSDVATIGHNQPPPDATVRPFEAVQAHVDDLYTEAKAWADGAPIRNQAQADEVSFLIDQLRKAKGAGDDARKLEAKPFDDGKAEVQARYKPLLDKCETAAKAAKAALGDWLQRVEAAQRAEREAAARAAQEAAAAAAAARAAADESNLADVERAEALTQEAEDRAQAARKAERERAGGFGGSRAITLRSYFHPELRDGVVAARHYWETRRADCEAFFLSLAEADVRAGKRALPGFEILEERRPA